jgi:hypothetical protein
MRISRVVAMADLPSAPYREKPRWLVLNGHFREVPVGCPHT